MIITDNDMRALGVWDEDLRAAALDKVFPADRGPAVAAAFEKSGSLYLHGDAGRGKSFLAAALFRAATSRWNEAVREAVFKTYRFIRANDLIAEIRATFESGEDSERDVADKYSNYTLLIVDDLGVTKATEHVIQTLDDITDFRYRTQRQRRTVFTSNLTAAALGKLYGDRLASRVAGMCEVFECGGEDRRQ